MEVHPGSIIEVIPGIPMEVNPGSPMEVIPGSLMEINPGDQLDVLVVLHLMHFGQCVDLRLTQDAVIRCQEPISSDIDCKPQSWLLQLTS